MELWKRLYGTVWLAFFSCVIIPRWAGSRAGLLVHIVLGLAIFVIAWQNSRILRPLPVPNRLKRIGKTILGFAVFQLVFGLAFGALMGILPSGQGFLVSASRLAHVVCALAILAQASSLATAYDMWEEKEFQESSRQ